MFSVKAGAGFLSTLLPVTKSSWYYHNLLQQHASNVYTFSQRNIGSLLSGRLSHALGARSISCNPQWEADIQKRNAGIVVCMYSLAPYHLICLFSDIN